MAHCLTTGLLVPADEAAASSWCQRAADLGSADAALKLGVAYFEGHPPCAQDGARAFDYFSRALELCKRQMAAEAGVHGRVGGSQGVGEGEPAGGAGGSGDESCLPCAALELVRRSALSWLGRCYLEGQGVPYNVKDAASYFRRAENKCSNERGHRRGR